MIPAGRRVQTLRAEATCQSHGTEVGGLAFTPGSQAPESDEPSGCRGTRRQGHLLALMTWPHGSSGHESPFQPQLGAGGGREEAEGAMVPTQGTGEGGPKVTRMGIQEVEGPVHRGVAVWEQRGSAEDGVVHRLGWWKFKTLPAPASVLGCLTMPSKSRLSQPPGAHHRKPTGIAPAHLPLHSGGWWHPHLSWEPKPESEAGVCPEGHPHRPSPCQVPAGNVESPDTPAHQGQWYRPPACAPGQLAFLKELQA